ncbi:hypothetical protein Tsubulata_044344 [Turnera subulata]|uniref:rRNA N-glycosylase n=1 Tax=Turnera subulata TaxID=218843 RepID=A0A9Q0GHF3_9ROSI|nr:hypothetical protein Tsubulata_044344 [Turnera subulata]
MSDFVRFFHGPKDSVDTYLTDDRVELFDMGKALDYGNLVQFLRMKCRRLINVEYQDLYVVGFKTMNIQTWLRFKDEEYRDLFTPAEDCKALQFSSDYGSLMPNEDMLCQTLGLSRLQIAVKKLGKLDNADDQDSMKPELFTLLFMIPEAARSQTLFLELLKDGCAPRKFELWMWEVYSNWSKMCADIIARHLNSNYKMRD